MPETFMCYAGKIYHLASSSSKTNTIDTFGVLPLLYQSYAAIPDYAICLHPSACA